MPVPEVSGVPEPPVVPNFIAGLEKLEMDVVRVGAYATRPVAKGHNEVEIMLLLAVRAQPSPRRSEPAERSNT